MKLIQPVTQVLLFLFALSFVGSAVAQDRVALVIGINDYPENSNFPDLKNCINDAKLVSQTLKSVGFEVIEATDCNLSAMEEKLSEFRNKIPEGGTALVYFAGHGIEYENVNYLMAGNAKLHARSELSDEAKRAETFAATMVQAGAKSSFLLLDCCRELPAHAEWAGRGQKKFGLADLKVQGDIVISMAASPGKQALEPNEEGANSPYASALAKWIPSGLKHTDVFEKVRREVFTITEKKQRTWENGSFIDPFFFAERESEAPKNAAQLAAMEAKIAELTNALAAKNSSAEEIERLKSQLATMSRPNSGGLPASDPSNSSGTDMASGAVLPSVSDSIPVTKLTPKTNPPAVGSDSQKLLSEARRFREAGDIEKAIAYSSKAIAADAANGSAWNLRGVIRQGLGEHVVAREDYLKAVELKPTSIVILKNAINSIDDLAGEERREGSGSVKFRNELTEYRERLHALMGELREPSNLKLTSSKDEIAEAMYRQLLRSVEFEATRWREENGHERRRAEVSLHFIEALIKNGRSDLARKFFDELDNSIHLLDTSEKNDVFMVFLALDDKSGAESFLKSSGLDDSKMRGKMSDFYGGFAHRIAGISALAKIGLHEEALAGFSERFQEVMEIKRWDDRQNGLFYAFNGALKAGLFEQARQTGTMLEDSLEKGHGLRFRSMTFNERVVASIGCDRFAEAEELLNEIVVVYDGESIARWKSGHLSRMGYEAHRLGREANGIDYFRRAETLANDVDSSSLARVRMWKAAAGIEITEKFVNSADIYDKKRLRFWIPFHRKEWEESLDHLSAGFIGDVEVQALVDIIYESFTGAFVGISEESSSLRVW